jgi:dihydrofolate reductase
MHISFIVAAAKNGVIGSGGALPWHLPEDLQRFRTLTFGKPVLMGRKTFDSILVKNGKSLPNRTNIVITRQKDYRVPEGVLVYDSIENALKAHEDEEELCVIGGGEIFRQMIDRVDTIHFTYIDKCVDGDTYFPPLPRDNWKVTERIERNGYHFITYERKDAKLKKRIT